MGNGSGVSRGDRNRNARLAPPDRNAADLTERERAALADLDERTRTGSGYSAEHSTRPQTIGYSMTDSPAGLCAWIVEKLWAWTDHPGDLSQVLTADQVLDNISLYWLAGSGASSARLYWESITEVTGWFATATRDVVTVPAGCRVSSPRRHRGPPAAGPSNGSPTSSTGANPTAAATSPQGNNRACSPAKSAPSPGPPPPKPARDHPQPPASGTGQRD